MALAALIALGLAGCTSPRERFEDGTQLAQMLFGAGQNDAIVQGNAQKAAEALERAGEQTCAEAGRYRAAAEQAATPVEALASESAGIRESFETAMNEQNAAARIASDFTGRRDGSWQAFSEAYDELAGLAFSPVFGPDGSVIGADFNRLRGNLPVGRVWEATERLFNELRNVSRDLLTATEDLRFAMQTTEGAALTAAWGDPEVDLPAMLDSLVSDANALNDEWIGLTTEEISIPSDRSTLISGMDGSDRRALNDLVDRLRSVSWQAKSLHRGTGAATDYFDDIQDRINDSRREQTARTAELADETGRLAAEATRNAWLAVEACGGEVPPEYLGLLQDPFDAYRPIPQWNSTFWDISSP